MEHRIFSAADILLPKNSAMDSWAVIACDQYSSDKSYWERVGEKAYGVPSTLHMVVPEAYLGDITTADAASKRNAVMNEYISADIFDTLKDSLVYVERTVTGGKVRHGIVGKLDLEAYDYSKETKAPVRASENTLIERLPPRIAVREGAVLELPHIMVLIDDESCRVIEPLSLKKALFPKLYDFDLMEGGGHIEGYRVSGTEAEKVLSALDCLSERPFAMVIGDGNHSLAAAKAYWDRIKAELSESERDKHPARFALVEVNNVYDDGVQFEPIHRVVFGEKPEKLICALKKAFGSGGGRNIRYMTGNTRGTVSTPSGSLGGLIGEVQKFLHEYTEKNGGIIDYIHDDESAAEFAKKGDAVALFMPSMDKRDLFATVAAEGTFPKKSFSIGHARDKRYYLECRRIK